MESHQEWLERKPAFRLNWKRVGGPADITSPLPRREAGPCTRVSFSRWMKGMSRRMASPRHFGPSSRMTSVSSLHPFHTARFQPTGSEWLGSPNNTYSPSLPPSASVPLTRQLLELLHLVLQYTPNLDSHPQNGSSISNSNLVSR